MRFRHSQTQAAKRTKHYLGQHEAAAPAASVDIPCAIGVLESAVWRTGMFGKFIATVTHYINLRINHTTPQTAATTSPIIVRLNTWGGIA